MSTKQERIAELMGESQLLAARVDAIREQRKVIKNKIIAIEQEPDPVSEGVDAHVEGQTLVSTSP